MSEDDIDVMVAHEDLEKVRLEGWGEKYYSKKSEIRFNKSNGEYGAGLINKDIIKARFDIFVVNTRGDLSYINMGGDKRLVWSSHHFKNLGDIEIGGEKFKIPNDPEVYCETYYGSDWKTKNTNWSWQKNSANLVHMRNVD